MTDALSKLLAGEYNKRNNPTDLKPSIIGAVVALTPLIVSIEEGSIILTEGDELLISEGFRFRCDIDKTKTLSETTVNEVNTAIQVMETHSQGGAPCNMPNAIMHVANAILAVKDELLKLKCELKVGDLVCLESLDTKNGYLLIEKVLSDVSN